MGKSMERDVELTETKMLQETANLDILLLYINLRDNNLLSGKRRPGSFSN